MAILIEEKVEKISSFVIELTQEEAFALNELLAYTRYLNPLNDLSDILEEVAGGEFRDAWKLGPGKGGLKDKGLKFIPEET